MTKNKLGSEIKGEEYLVLHEFAKKAKGKLPKETWDYLIGAAETETTFKRNRYALDSLAFRPRVLRDVEKVNSSSKLFGHELRIPIILAPSKFNHSVNQEPLKPVCPVTIIFLFLNLLNIQLKIVIN